MRFLSSVLFLSLVTALGLAQSLTAAENNNAPSGGGEKGGGGWTRMIAENPELKGVDPSTPEGQQKMRTVMETQVHKRINERQTANHAKLKTTFAMSDAEFSAIEPMLTKVESLRQQKMIVDPPTAMFRGGPGGGSNGESGGNRGRGSFNPLMLLGGAELEPSVKEIQEAMKSLKTLVEDLQSNEAEMTAVVNRVRKSREGYQAALGKAQDELRSVLTPRQEAILIEQGALE